VIFVHGLVSSDKVWEPMRRLLAEDLALSNAYDVEQFEYDSPRIRVSPQRRIPDFNALADRLAGRLDTTPHRRVVLVAHSQGGLIVQRYLVRQLAEGNGRKLTRIRRIILFACPNNGSEFLLSLRRLAIRRHSQERELRPIAESVIETQRKVLADVVYATAADDRRCPIPIACYAGDADNIVTAASAKGVFPIVGVLPGDHSSIIRPDSATHPSYAVLRDGLRAALDEELLVPGRSSGLGVGSVGGSEYFVEMTVRGPIMVRFESDPTFTVPVYVRSGPVDQVSDIDIVATSENIYMQMAMTFKPSVSGRLRRAAARKGPAGEIIEDIAAEELNDWMRQHGRYGLPVEPGTVAATSAGELAKRNIHRIYHAAIGIPIVGTDRFEVNPHSVAQAVHNVFEIGRRERDELGLPLKSMLLPLFGAGLGGLSPAICFEWMWRALQQELEQDSSWVVHFCTWSKAETEVILSAIQRHADVG
jgi:pimeloyl-ACP methyl ester carboxylesterase